MQLDKQFVLEELKKTGRSEQVQKAEQELPEKIDHEVHSDLLAKFGIDPGKLAERAVEKGLGSL
jgi:F0F1-type ATP synthase membrane subunit b/b'